MPEPPQRRSPLVLLLLIAAPLVGAGGIVFGVIWLGWLAKQHLGDRNKIDFAAIECTPPPGMVSAEFLDDVRYYAELAGKPVPDQLEANEDLPKTLVEAFLQYPWVETIEGITVTPDKRVQLKLKYRRPVLAAQVDGSRRAVEARGILLPKAAGTEGLPFLRDGQFRKRDNVLWGDERVRAAAGTVAFLRDNQDRLVVTEIGGNADNLQLTTARGARVVWGHPPGAEPAGERTAQQKCEVLTAGDEPSGLLDLRRPDGER